MDSEFGLVRANVGKDIERRLSLVEAQLQKRLNYLMDSINKLESTLESLNYKEALTVKHLVNEKIVEFIKYSEYLIRNELSEVPIVLEEWLGTFEKSYLTIQKTQEQKSKTQVDSLRSDVQQDSDIFINDVKGWCDKNSEQIVKIKAGLVGNSVNTLNDILQIKNVQKEQSTAEWENSQQSVFLIQQQFDKLKAACLTNSEKLDHNIKILKKQEEENSKILNSIKRKQTQQADNLSKLTDTRLSLESNLVVIQQIRGTRNEKLDSRIKNAMIQFDAIKSKAERDFDNLWKLKEQQISQLLSDIRQLNFVVSSDKLAAVEDSGFSGVDIVQGYDSDHQLQVSDTTTKVLNTMSPTEKSIVKEFALACINIVPDAIRNAVLSEEDLLVMQTEYLLKYFKVSSIPQYLDLLAVVKSKPVTQTYPELAIQINKSVLYKTSDYTEYWSSCIPKVKDIQLLNYDTNYKFQNFQSSHSLIKEIELLLKDQEFLTNALK